MRFKMRSVLVALTAMLVVSVGVANAAQAAEGPFFKVGGGRLAAGESRELKVSFGGEYTMSSGALQYTCHKQKLQSAELLGSSGANTGTSKETVVFEECSIEGNGSACKIENNTITTTPLTMELAYATGERTGKILALLKPAKHTFATIKLVGNCELLGPRVLEGSLAGEIWSGGKAVEVGKEPVEAKASELKFNSPRITKAWTEHEGKLTESKPQLIEVSSGRSVLVIGRTQLTLGGEPQWGIYTK